VVVDVFRGRPDRHTLTTQFDRQTLHRGPVQIGPFSKRGVVGLRTALTFGDQFGSSAPIIVELGHDVRANQAEVIEVRVRAGKPVWEKILGESLSIISTTETIDFEVNGVGSRRADQSNGSNNKR
jgi:hypothetical protein